MLSVKTKCSLTFVSECMVKEAQANPPEGNAALLLPTTMEINNRSIQRPQMSMVSLPTRCMGDFTEEANTVFKYQRISTNLGFLAPL